MADSSATVTQIGLTAAGFLVKSNLLGPYFGVSAETGSGGNPAIGSGGNPAIGSGGNPAIGSGGNPAIGSGGNPAIGSGGNPAIGSGGNPAIGSGSRPCLCGSFAIALEQACGGAERSGPTMPFRVDTQDESHWCWAAVSSAVDRYYSPLAFLAQCEVASDVLHEPDVCNDPEAYNDPGALADGLSVVGRYDREDPEGIRITFDALQTEIDAGRPVCVCIQWNGSQNAAHFVALCGYREWSGGLRLVDVADPFYPDSTQDFDAFPDSYHGGGSWLQTFFTK